MPSCSPSARADMASRQRCARHGCKVAGGTPAVPGILWPVLADDPLWPYAAAAAEGDNVAVAELVRRTEQAVWQVCAALGSDGEVEDLVQETYLRALRSLPRFRGDAPVRLWLLSIARRTCADHVRRRQRQRRLLDRLTIEAAGDGSGGSGFASDISLTVELLQRLQPGPPRSVRSDAARRPQLRRGGGDRWLPDRHDPLACRQSPGRLAGSVGNRRDRRLTRRQSWPNVDSRMCSAVSSAVGT